MYFSKGNLLVVDVVSSDMQQGIITGVHIDSDGSTVGTDGGTLLVVEPVAVVPGHFPDVGPLAPVGASGVTVDAEVVRQAIKNMPKDKVMQYAAMTETVTGETEFTTVGKRKRQKVAGWPMSGAYPGWRNMVRDARELATRTRVAVNRRKLAALLKVMDAACPDSGGDNVAFLEVGGDNDMVVLRAKNYQTGQHAVGMMAPVRTGGQWLANSDWEARIVRGHETGGARGRRIGG
jgi:hypothetical protein